MTKILALDPQTDELLSELNNRGNKLFFEDKHIHEIEGEHSFTFTMPSIIPEARNFGERGRFLIPSEEKGFHEFIIYKTFTTMNSQKQVIGIAAYTEMDKSHIVEPGTYTGTIVELVNLALPFTEYRLGVFEDIRILSITIENHMGAYAFLVKVAKLFEAEMRFRVEVAGTRFTGRYVDFVKRLGTDIHKEVVYGEDLASMEMTVHSERIVTELLCLGPEKEDGTRLSVTVRDEDAFQRWNRKGKPIVAIYEPESSRQEMTIAELQQYGRTELNKRIASVVEYEFEAASIEKAYAQDKVLLGSTLRIKNPKFEPPLYADARAIRIERSIVDDKRKVYKIGEVKAYTQEEIFQTFRQLQHLYGTKLIHKETAPDGQPKTIWIDTGTPLNVPHTFNFSTNEWEKFAPTNAAEIGGLMVGQQYNGVAITPEEGLVVDRTDGLVKTIVNATEGISIQARATDTGTFQDVFFAGEDGKLTLKGIDIVREDGFKVVNNGTLTYDLNVQGVEPPFHTGAVTIHQGGYGQWYSTRSLVSVDLNQYSFRHQGRYLKVSYRVLVEAGNTAYFEIWRNGELAASAYTSQSDEYAPGVLTGYTLTVDLGVPTGLPSTFQLRLRSTVQGLSAYAMIRGKWLEG